MLIVYVVFFFSVLVFGLYASVVMIKSAGLQRAPLAQLPHLPIIYGCVNASCMWYAHAPKMGVMALHDG